MRAPSFSTGVGMYTVNSIFQHKLCACQIRYGVLLLEWPCIRGMKELIASCIRSSLQSQDTLYLQSYTAHIDVA